MKCFVHTQTRGRAPKDCEDCQKMLDTEDFPIPAIDDRAILQAGDKVLRPLITMYKKWESAIRYAKIGVLVSLDGDKAKVKIDGETFDTDASFLVKVL